MASTQTRLTTNVESLELDFPRFLATPVLCGDGLIGFRLWITSRRAWPKRLYVRARGIANETLPATGNCFVNDRHVLVETSFRWISMSIAPELEIYDH